MKTFPNITAHDMGNENSVSTNKIVEVKLLSLLVSSLGNNKEQN